MPRSERKPAHKRFRLDPPHGDDTLYWVAEGRIPGDSRTEFITVSRAWFWRGLADENRRDSDGR